MKSMMSTRSEIDLAYWGIDKYKEQQTSDNLIVKDNCFIIEIFDNCSFSGILRGCLSNLSEA